MKRARRLTPVGSALDGALQEFGLERRMREQQIFLRWDEIVGTAIANHATPKRLANGVLWISVRDAAWRQELVLMRERLRATINAAIGAAIVEEVVLR